MSLCETCLTPNTRIGILHQGGESSPCPDCVARYYGLERGASRYLRESVPQIERLRRGAMRPKTAARILGKIAYYLPAALWGEA